VFEVSVKVLSGRPSPTQSSFGREGQTADEAGINRRSSWCQAYWLPKVTWHHVIHITVYLACLLNKKQDCALTCTIVCIIVSTVLCIVHCFSFSSHHLAKTGIAILLFKSKGIPREKKSTW